MDTSVTAEHKTKSMKRRLQKKRRKDSRKLESQLNELEAIKAKVEYFQNLAHKFYGFGLPDLCQFVCENHGKQLAEPQREEEGRQKEPTVYSEKGASTLGKKAFYKKEKQYCHCIEEISKNIDWYRLHVRSSDGYDPVLPHETKEVDRKRKPTYNPQKETYGYDVMTIPEKLDVLKKTLKTKTHRLELYRFYYFKTFHPELHRAVLASHGFKEAENIA